MLPLPPQLPTSLTRVVTDIRLADRQTDLQSGQTSKTTKCKEKSVFRGGSSNSRGKPSALSFFEEQIAPNNLFDCSLNQFMNI